MTPAQLEELKKLCAEATPGPWRFTESSKPALLEDAEFISAARTAVPELITEVERLRAIVRKAEREGVALHDGLSACPWCRSACDHENPLRHSVGCPAFAPDGEAK